MALITIDSGFQIHPVIATRWAGNLGRKSKKLIMIMASLVPTMASDCSVQIMATTQTRCGYRSRVDWPRRSEGCLKPRDVSLPISQLADVQRISSRCCGTMRTLCPV